MKPDSLMSDKVICSGIVRPVLYKVSELIIVVFEVEAYAAASGCGEAKAGRVNRYVFNGLAWTLVFRVKNASPL
jgi:hypothetical protein